MKFLAINALNLQVPVDVNVDVLTWCTYLVSRCTYHVLYKSLSSRSVMKPDFVPKKLKISLNNKNTTNYHQVLYNNNNNNNILIDWHFSVLGFRCVSSPNPPTVPTQQALRWPAWRFRWWRWTKMATLTWHTSRPWWELICIPLGFMLQQHMTTKVITGQQNLTDAGRHSSDPV